MPVSWLWDAVAAVSAGGPRRQGVGREVVGRPAPVGRRARAGGTEIGGAPGAGVVADGH